MRKLTIAALALVAFGGAAVATEGDNAGRDLYAAPLATSEVRTPVDASFTGSLRGEARPASRDAATDLREYQLESANR